jgi:hypothetical protein
VSPLSIALLPIALAPLAWLLAEVRTRRGLAIALVALTGAFWIWANHGFAMRSQWGAGDPEPDAIAAGTFLRGEMVAPHLLALGPAAPPVRVWTDSMFKNYAILYSCGLMGRLEEWKGAAPASSMRQGQYLVTDRRVDDPRLSLRWQVGRFNIYQLAQPQESAAGR